MTVLSDSLTIFLLDFTWFCSVFLCVVDRKFNKDSKNVPKNMIRSLQVGFTGDFVPECTCKLCSSFKSQICCTKLVFPKLLENGESYEKFERGQKCS